MIVHHLGRAPRTNDREIYQAEDGRCFIVIRFETSDIKIFDGCEDGSVRNWTPLYHSRLNLNPTVAMRRLGMEVA